ELSTWLTRIVINEALMRVRKRRRDQNVVSFSERADAAPALDVADDTAESPSDAALRGEVRKVLEKRIDELPEAFRTVFAMREVEDMTARETAEALGIPETTVRTRLFRARAMLREALDRDMDSARSGVFGFDGARCDRIVSSVLLQLEAESWKQEAGSWHPVAQPGTSGRARASNVHENNDPVRIRSARAFHIGLRAVSQRRADRLHR